MKFCCNCGRQMKDEERFCPSCGTDSAAGQNTAQQQNAAQLQSTAQPYSQPVYTYGAGQQYNMGQTYGQPVYGNQTQAPSTKKSISGKLPIIAAAVVIVAVLAVFLFRCVVGSGSLTMKGAVKDYFAAVEDGSGRKILNASFSNPMIKAYCEATDTTKKELREMLEIDYDEYGVAVDYREIKIEDKEKRDKDDIKELNEDCKDDTGVNPHISKAYTVEVSYEYRYSYGDEWSDWDEKTDTFTVYKSNGNWYVMDDSIF